jgi:hypothetical protein
MTMRVFGSSSISFSISASPIRRHLEIDDGVLGRLGLRFGERHVDIGGDGHGITATLQGARENASESVVVIDQQQRRALVIR